MNKLIVTYMVVSFIAISILFYQINILFNLNSQQDQVNDAQAFYTEMVSKTLVDAIKCQQQENEMDSVDQNSPLKDLGIIAPYNKEEAKP